MTMSEADRVVAVLTNAVSTRGVDWVEANPDAIRELLRSAKLPGDFPVGPVLIALQIGVMASLEGRDNPVGTGLAIDDLVQRVATLGQLEVAVARMAVDTWVRVLGDPRSGGGDQGGTKAGDAVLSNRGTVSGGGQETSL